MDYKNLMVGDWVRFRNDYPQKALQGKIAKVRGINGRVDVRTMDGEYHSSEHPNWLEPIPITQEILKKSGFVKNGNCHSIVIERQMAGDGIECQFVGIYNCSSITIEYASGKLHISIKYVHELQHLLKLCGIKKEIEL